MLNQLKMKFSVAFLFVLFLITLSTSKVNAYSCAPFAFASSNFVMAEVKSQKLTCSEDFGSEEINFQVIQSFNGNFQDSFKIVQSTPYKCPGLEERFSGHNIQPIYKEGEKYLMAVRKERVMAIDENKNIKDLGRFDIDDCNPILININGYYDIKFWLGIGFYYFRYVLVFPGVIAISIGSFLTKLGVSGIYAFLMSILIFFLELAIILFIFYKLIKLILKKIKK